MWFSPSPSDGRTNMSPMWTRAARPISVTANRLLGNISATKRFRSSSYIPTPARSMSYSVLERGCPNSLEYRVYISKFVTTWSFERFYHDDKSVEYRPIDEVVGYWVYEKYFTTELGF